MSTFQETLKRLLSRNIVITKTKSGKLRTIDFNKSQSTGSPTQYQNRPKWKMSRGYSTTSGYGSGFTNEEIEALRKQMYQDYDIMDTDAIVSSVIDIYSDECLGQDTIIPLLDGRRLTIKELYDLNETNFWLYGLDNFGNFKPSKAEKVIYKGLQKCAKITLDDQTIIKCTLEHLWVVDGVNCQMTKDLQVGDSIYALKTKLSSGKRQLREYEMISDNKNFKTKQELVDYCKNNDIRVGSVERILNENHYKSIPDFIKSKNHRIVNIEYCEDHVYDIVNVSDNHLFAIETLDGSKLFTHNCTTYSEQGELLVIKTNDEKIKKVLHNLFYDIMNLDFNLWPWIKTTCKYGDNFLYLQVAEGVGVVNVMPIHPILIIREEGINGDPQSIRFRYEGEYGQGWAPNHYFEETQIAHFRLLSDVNFLPYGKSILEGGRQEFKRMRLMEDAMLLNRIMRAPERRLFKIDIGNIAPEEVDAYIEEISNSMKKTPYIDPTTGDLNLRYNILNAMEDFFLPVRGSDSGTSIETLPGLQNDKMLEDVEYFKNKMIAAFKVPKDYLGYGGEDNGGTGGKSNLAQVDIRFARTIERVQKIFVSEFYKIALIHLISQGFESEDLLNFELTLTNPSLVFERQKTDVMTARVDLAKSAREENPLLSDMYIYKNLWGFSDEEMEALKLQKIEDAKFQFRLKQIVEEGNDPEVTGKSFGTPHDIATMQVASKFMPGQYGETNKSLYTKDERENNEGKPDQHKSSFETRRDQDFGDDPNGRKDMNKMEALIKKFEKYRPKSNKEPLMLNEDNLLQNEDNYN